MAENQGGGVSRQELARQRMSRRLAPQRAANAEAERRQASFFDQDGQGQHLLNYSSMTEPPAFAFGTAGSFAHVRAAEAGAPRSPAIAAGAASERRQQSADGRRVRGPARTTPEERRDLLHYRRAQRTKLPHDLQLITTDVEAAALAFLIRRADADGRIPDLSLTEWGTRTKTPESSLKRVRKSLQEKGLIGWIVGERIGFFRNEENVYFVLGVALSAARAAFYRRMEERQAQAMKEDGAPGAIESPAKGESPISPQKILTTSRSTDSKPTSPKPQSSGGLSKAAPERSMSRAAEPDAPTAYALDLAATAVEEAIPGRKRPKTAAEIWEAVDDIRADLMPKLKPGLWRWIVAQRGWAAGLAVLETAILVRAKHVHDPGGYLWGIVRPTSDCAPAITLGRIIGHRRAPGVSNLRTKIRWPSNSTGNLDRSAQRA